LTRVQKATLIHPNLKLDIEYIDDLDDNSVLLMEEFRPFIPFLKKMSFEIKSRESITELTSNTYRFEELDCLELDTSQISSEVFYDPVQQEYVFNSIQKTTEDFWDNFCNITSLTVYADYAVVSPFFQFIETISKKCQKLEKLFYYSDSTPHIYLEKWGIKEDNKKTFELELQKVEKMPNVTDLDIYFILLDYAIDPYNDVQIDQQGKNNLMQNFQIYFSTKCPNLNSSIKVTHNEYGEVTIKSNKVPTI